MAFADNLKELPAVTNLIALQLLDATGMVVATIENKPGKVGSLTIYAALAATYGRIDVAAATEGLELFAEHTVDARAHPGHHPNIDRLLGVIATGECFLVKLLEV